jgi:carbon monoxide dehydrogenase subunit G
MRIEESVEVRRPLQEVFGYVSDVGNYAHWMAHVLEVRKDTPGPPQQGDRFVVAIKSVGRRFETPYDRTTYEAGRRLTDEAAGGPVPIQRWHSTFREADAATRLTRAVDAELGGLLKLLAPFQKRAAERQLRQDLQTLKSVLEDGRGRH